MSNISGKGKKSDEVSAVYTVVVFVCLAIAIIGGLYAYYFYPNPISHDSEEWARYGEYIGGTIGPITGFATIIILWRTLRIQRKDSNEQMRIVRMQGFEQTLFSWISLHRDIVMSMKATGVSDNLSATGELNGLHALGYWYDEIFSDGAIRHSMPMWLHQKGMNTLGFLSNRHGSMSEEKKRTLMQYLMEIWDDFYRNSAFQLDSYFRTLYRLFKWIDDQPESLLSIDEKFEYAALVRAQLSWVELAFLFFNGMTNRGHQFSRYYETYSILDNFDVDDGSLLGAVRSVSEYSKDAYDSDEARYHNEEKELSGK